MNDFVTLLLGFVCAGIGGELFVAGTVGIAGAAQISPAIVAATVAAFATSTPELTVSVTAALNGTPQIGLGDVLGSNVVNVALILGLGLLIAPIPAPRDHHSPRFSPGDRGADRHRHPGARRHRLALRRHDAACSLCRVVHFNRTRGRQATQHEGGNERATIRWW